jgi:hypothetical protein
MCTFVACPIGSCVGCGLAACGRGDTAKKVLMGIFSAMFVAGCICYIALTIACAKADGDHWTLTRGDGECWSEGGSMPFVTLGWWTGVLTGVGFFGAFVMVFRIHHENEKANIELGSYDKVVDEHVI